MRITDKAAIILLKKLNSSELWERVYSYPEDERDGRSDMQMLADEAGYMLSLFEEDGTAHHDDLKLCRHILNRTKYGKVMPIYFPSMKPVYNLSDIQTAKDVVNEYNRLKRFVKRMEKNGYYSQWY